MRVSKVLAIGLMAMMLPMTAAAAPLVVEDGIDYGTSADWWKLTANGGAFSVTTAGSDLDTQLFLFDSHWKGVLANDNDISLPSLWGGGGGGFPSTITGSLVAGIYYLAVSAYNVDPVSASGLIFPDQGAGIVGPTGPGGNDPQNGFTELYFATSPYTLTLTGFSEAVPAATPEPATLLLFGAGAAGLARRSWQKRRQQTLSA